MSLKFIHLVFIVAATLLSAFFGYWGLMAPAEVASPGLVRAMGVFSAITAVCLVPYLIWFLKKSKGWGFLTLAFMFLSNSSWACSVCLGDPSSPLVKSVNNGVWFLLVIVGGVLGSFGSLFLYWIYRAKKLSPKL